MKFLNVRLSAACRLGLGPLGLRHGVLLGLPLCFCGGHNGLPVLKLHGAPCVRFTQALGLLCLRPEHGNVVLGVQPLLVCKAVDHLHHRLKLVILAADAVIVHALLGQCHHFRFVCLPHLAHVPQLPCLGPCVHGLCLGLLRLGCLFRVCGGLSVLFRRLCALTGGLGGRFLASLHRLCVHFRLVCRCFCFAVPAIQKGVRSFGLLFGDLVHVFVHIGLFPRPGLAGSLYFQSLVWLC